MRGHFPQPLDTGWLKRNIGVKSARNCSVDCGLPSLLQQRDHLLLRLDIALDAPVHVLKVTGDGGLFGEGGEG